MLKKVAHSIVMLLAVFLLSTAASARDTKAKQGPKHPVEIRISYQPAFWALPWFIATEKGWWDEFGLKPKMILFAAGAAQIAAGASGEWDVGGAGDIPAVLGGSKYGLINIAISDNEKAILTVMAGSQQEAQRYTSDPKLIAGKEIPTTLSSNGERVTVACLDKLGAKPNSYKLANLAPGDINVAMLSKRFDLAGVWAPNTYILEEAIGAKVICRGTETDVNATGRLFVTPAFAEKNPQAVARFLALYFHAVEWGRQHPDETLSYLKKFYDSMGMKVPVKNLPDEVKDHVYYSLKEQLDLYSRSGSKPSKVDAWTNDVAKFLVSKGSIPAVPKVEEYVTDKYLKMVSDDAELTKLASGGR